MAGTHQNFGQCVTGTIQNRQFRADGHRCLERLPSSPARRLELEITEAVFIGDDEAALAILHQLRKLGVRIALDDFGTRFATLSYLQRFPFDRIKIDRSFIKDVAKAPRLACPSCRRWISIAKSRNMTTTAEGVETEDQSALLRALGCTEMQGFLFSPAIPPADFLRLALTHRERKS